MKDLRIAMEKNPAVKIPRNPPTIMITSLVENANLVYKTSFGIHQYYMSFHSTKCRIVCETSRVGDASWFSYAFTNRFKMSADLRTAFRVILNQLENKWALLGAKYSSHCTPTVSDAINGIKLVYYMKIGSFACGIYCFSIVIFGAEMLLYSGSQQF